MWLCGTCGAVVEVIIAVYVRDGCVMKYRPCVGDMLVPYKFYAGPTPREILYMAARASRIGNGSKIQDPKQELKTEENKKTRKKRW